MTALAILLMTTAVPSADPVAQPPPASPQRFSHLRGLFGRRSQGPQQQPGSAWVGPPGGAVQPVPIAARPITPPVTSQGPQQQPGGAAGAPPGGAGRVVPVPVSGTPSASGPSPAMSRPEVTTPPVPPEMRRMPIGPADPF